MVQVAFSRTTEQVIHGRSRWHQRSALTPSPADRVEYDAPSCGEDRRERGQPIAFAFAHRHATHRVRGELRVDDFSRIVGPTKKNVAMTAREALAFIRKHGVVLESARGPVPSLAQVIAGEPVRGSWWSHPKSHEIFAVTRAVRDSDDVLCRLIDGKITFVHRRLWPALVRVADRLPSVRLSQLREVHTRSGRHVTTEVPFPDWVPSNVRAVARSLSEAAALAAFAWIE